MDNIRILLLADKNAWAFLSLPRSVKLEHRKSLEDLPAKNYELVLLDRTPTEAECETMHMLTRAYTLFVTEHVDISACRCYYESKMGRVLNTRDVPEFLTQEALWFFPKPYGEKYTLYDLTVSRNFTGSVRWDGNYALCLKGSFGETPSQIAFWKNNIPLQEGQTLDFWLEYRKSPEVHIRFQAVLIDSGSLDKVVGTWCFCESELEQIIQIRAERKGYLFVSLDAQGQGSLDIIALHDRYSRGKYGYFIPGGERYVTSEREEIFCYFDPGDCKPPLNVYFSGYKTQQGFEGFNLMRSMGTPFLLVSEPRLEGGGFYIGSEEYESLMVSLLNRYREKLGFTRDQVILSGISMGSTGALYYGTDICPHAIIVGKPLINLGDIARNEKRIRPGGFPTSLDILRVFGGENSEAGAEKLNERFWKKLEKADWSRTKLILSYMLEDDYDPKAYDELLTSLSVKNSHIYGRGLHGRHNDNTRGIVQWFSSQFRKILREDFPESMGTFRQEIMK